MSRNTLKQMSAIDLKKNLKRQKVIFSFEANGAKEVALSGDFNKWNPKTHLMKQDSNGTWKKALVIPAGTYQYKFVVDGNWMVDPQNDQTCMNDFGTLNSVLNIS